MYFQQVIMVIVLCSGLRVVMTTCSSGNVEKICVEPETMRALMRINKEKENNSKPAFFASLKVHVYTAQGLNDVLKFEDVRINRGGGYNPATGYFTAPRKGLYHISCMIFGYPGEPFHFQLNKNDVLYNKGYVDKSEYQTQTISVLVDMKKGDRVYIKHRASSAEKIHGSNFSTFSGYFVDE